jgi:hypothetical protein
MKTQNMVKFGLMIIGGLIVLGLVQKAYAFQVPPLPTDNLLQNPWFRDPSNPSLPSFESWVNVNNFWTLSQKISNPAPDAYVSGKCDDMPTYCGTAAKISADDGNGQVGVDSYLYQIVSANPDHTKLKFSTHWVTHYVDPFEINIYGSANANGPWTLVWTPVYEEVLTLLTPPPGQGTDWLWMEMTSWTPPVEKVLSTGFPHYKVEVHAKLPSPEGFKLTGIYFAAVDADGPPQTPPPFQTLTPTPRVSETPSPAPTPSSTPSVSDFQIFLPVIVNPNVDFPR